MEIKKSSWNWRQDEKERREENKDGEKRGKKNKRRGDREFKGDREKGMNQNRLESQK